MLHEDALIGIPSYRRAHRCETLKWATQTEAKVVLAVRDEELEVYRAAFPDNNFFVYKYTGQKLGAVREDILRYARQEDYHYLLMCDDDIPQIRYRDGTITEKGYARQRPVASYELLIDELISTMRESNLSVLTLVRSAHNALSWSPGVRLIMPYFGGDFLFIDLFNNEQHFKNLHSIELPAFQLDTVDAQGVYSVGTYVKYSYESPGSGQYKGKGDEGGLSAVDAYAADSYDDSCLAARGRPYVTVKEFYINERQVWHLRFNYKILPQLYLMEDNTVRDRDSHSGRPS
jgi:hypothetical protein